MRQKAQKRLIKTSSTAALDEHTFVRFVHLLVSEAMRETCPKPSRSSLGFPFSQRAENVLPLMCLLPFFLLVVLCCDSNLNQMCELTCLGNTYFATQYGSEVS